MASSRKSARAAKPSTSARAAVALALGGVAEVHPRLAPIAVAFSGGLDSTVLLDACCQVVGAARVVALHVHHGLQPAAEGWPEACRREAERLGAGFQVLRAVGAPARGDSIEAWARTERYRLLFEAATSIGAAALMTAHHADDQLETVLMAMARGSGLDGLSGIAARDHREGVLLMRPLLALRRKDLAREATERGLTWIEDPSNASERHLRNAVRRRVVPVLDAVLPGIGSRLDETVMLLSQARAALETVAAQDLAAAAWADPVAGFDALDRRALAALPPPRQAWALRAWVARLGESPPGGAKLEEIRAQLIDATSASAVLAHGELQLMRHRERIVGWHAGASASLSAAAPPAVSLQWHGEARLPVPGFGGWLVISPTGNGRGLRPEWLRTVTLRVAPGRGGARLRPRPDGPSRTLKNLYQECGVPAVMRAWFPAVWVDERLLMAAPFGMDRSEGWPWAGEGVSLRWESAAAGDPRRFFSAGQAV